ncbi:MAG: glycosyltransferase family 4 protein [Gammaproteobacteria bacterium]
MPRVIFVNRYFWPDQSATSRLLSDLAFELAGEDFEIHVVTSRQLIDDASAALAAYETHRNVQVHRIWTTQFGRDGLKTRAIDYLTFHLAARRKVAALAGDGDIVVAKTDPPLLSISLAPIAARQDARMVTWLQDVFPEVAGALGVVRKDGVLSRTIKRWRDASIQRAAVNVVLGSSMREVVLDCGVAPERVAVIPNWADGDVIEERGEAAQRLRQEWSLEGHFVVGYCGNLGRAHEFDTLLDAAKRLMPKKSIRFVFVGAGARYAELLDGIQTRGLDNVLIFPPQPEESLNALLGAMDVHAVCLMPALEGLVVPSKLYGVLAAGRPALNIGGKHADFNSLLTDSGAGAGFSVGDSEGVAQVIASWAEEPGQVRKMGRAARELFEREFARSLSIDKWRALLRTVSSG